MDDIFARRRSDLMARMGERAAAVIHGTRPARRNGDVEYRYRPPSDLLFLTGMTEPDSWAVLTPGKPHRFTMFVRPRDPERELWTGRRLGIEGAVSRLHADRAYPIEELRAQLLELLDGTDEVHCLPGDDPAADALVLGTLAQLRDAERRGRRAPTRIIDLRTTLHELRLIKDEHALAALRRAADITIEAHRAAMATARPGLHEYEVEALVDYTFRRRGASGPGYPTICGAGANGTILHYVENSAPIAPGQMLLLDAGAEWEGFTADITRTFPAGARFSPPQRYLYEAVLEVQRRCIAAVVPGTTIEAIHGLATSLLIEAMLGLGLLTGTRDEHLEREEYKRFYPHRTSHWLGLDVHDAGRYFPANVPRPLSPGMVITVEPGLYVPADAPNVPDELRGLAVRIEDDVLVTAAGHEVLTALCPREIDEIEALTTRAAG